MPIIEVKNVSHIYRSGQEEHQALTDVSFDIEQGEFVALVGHNGSGKSTLAKMLNGLILPTAGEVISVGISTSEEKRIFELRSQVGVVFQNPDNQMVATIIEDDVAFGPENLGIDPKEIDRRVDWALSCVGMSEHRKGTPARLSGGQKQRIAIARALVRKAPILVFDEATSALDAESERQIMETIGSLRGSHTILITTHNLNNIVNADKIIVMDKGRISEIGSHDKLMAMNGVYKRLFLRGLKE